MAVELDAAKYDAEQIRLMEEMLIVLDENDTPIGEGTKKECHLVPSDGSKSTLHRAFSVFLFHPESGKLLLQKRADEKITFPAMWTNTCCSHPLTSGGEMEEKDAIGVRTAAARKLTHELGIPHTYSLDDLTYLTRIHYYAPSDGVWAEHEIDYILFLTIDPKVDVNPNEISATKWVSKEELIEFFNDPTSTFTPWFKLISESFLYPWWDKLLATRNSTSEKLDARKLVPEIAQAQELAKIIRM